MYPEEIVVPMKGELTENGFTELLTATEVDTQLNKKGNHFGNDQFCLWLFSRVCPAGTFNGGC
jgi:putative YphP/YqiW family bacilliredoxin